MEPVVDINEPKVVDPREKDLQWDFPILTGRRIEQTSIRKPFEGLREYEGPLPSHCEHLMFNQRYSWLGGGQPMCLVL